MESITLSAAGQPAKVLRILQAALQLSGEERALLARLIATKAETDWDKQIFALPGVAKLSPRENQVIERVIAGRTSAEIAHELHIAEATVRSIRARARIKLQAKNNAELVRFALACGIRPVDGEARS